MMIDDCFACAKTSLESGLIMGHHIKHFGTTPFADLVVGKGNHTIPEKTNKAIMNLTRKQADY